MLIKYLRVFIPIALTILLIYFVFTIVNNFICGLDSSCASRQHAAAAYNSQLAKERVEAFNYVIVTFLRSVAVGLIVFPIFGVMFLIKRLVVIHDKDGMYPMVMLPKRLQPHFNVPVDFNDKTAMYLKSVSGNGQIRSSLAKNIIQTTSSLPSISQSYYPDPLIGDSIDAEVISSPLVELPRKVYIYDYLSEATYDDTIHVPVGVCANGTVSLSFKNSSGVLVGGRTGTGKSEFLASLIMSCAYMDSKGIPIKVSVVDMKQVDFSPMDDRYNFLFTPVIRDDHEAYSILNFMHEEMRRRATLFNSTDSRTISYHNSKVSPDNVLPYHVLVIDELADLTNNLVNPNLAKQFSGTLFEVLRKCRAFGIFIVVATQHPSIKVIPSEIRTQFSYHVAFKTRDRYSSEAIMASSGAESLPEIPGRCLVSYNKGIHETQAFLAGLDLLYSNDKTRFDYEIEKYAKRRNGSSKTTPAFVPETTTSPLSSFSMERSDLGQVEMDVRTGKYIINRESRIPTQSEAKLMKFLHERGWTKNMILGVRPGYSGFYGYKDNIVLDWINNAVSGNFELFPES